MNSFYNRNKYYISILILMLLTFLITVFASFVQKPNNIRTGTAAIPGDCEGGDGDVDILDFQALSNTFAKSPGDPGYNAACNFNSDPMIEILDYQLLSNNFGGTGVSDTPTLPPPASWEGGSFRFLPEKRGSIVSEIASLPHPNSGFVPLSPERQASFVAFFGSMQNTLRETRTNPRSADWCGTIVKAGSAGYTLSRFYDTATGRWFLLAKDKTGEGQASFVINPDAKRDIVIESPHSGYETNTDTEGIRVFLDLSARTFIINGADRCGSNLVAQCTTGTSNACGSYKASDVPHDTRNTFHLAHKVYSDTSTLTRFIQLHGMNGTSSDNAEASDSTTTGFNASSISVNFIRALRQNVPNPNSLHSCQESGSTPQGLCATKNVQGRYTNSPSQNECTSYTAQTSNRFIHVEQSLTLRDDNAGDGFSWKSVSNAVKTVWGNCSLGASSGDCALGAIQSVPSPCVCGQSCN